MKTVSINGSFIGSVNRYVRLDVYRPNPQSYDFSKTFDNDFNETLQDLEDDTEYFIDITGFTFGEFDLEITGEFIAPNPITDHFENSDFKPGYLICTNS